MYYICGVVRKQKRKSENTPPFWTLYQAEAAGLYCKHMYLCMCMHTQPTHNAAIGCSGGDPFPLELSLRKRGASE